MFQQSSFRRVISLNCTDFSLNSMHARVSVHLLARIWIWTAVNHQTGLVGLHPRDVSVYSSVTSFVLPGTLHATSPGLLP